MASPFTSEAGKTKNARHVVIIGAGVGGLALAAALRNDPRVRVTVVERRSDPSSIESGGGFILWNNAVKALRRLGLADEVIKSSTQLHSVHWRTPVGRTLATWPIAD